MRFHRHLSIPLLAVCLLFVAAQSNCRAAAAPRIDVELATEAGVPPTNAQQWYQLFTDLKITNLRIRGAESADQPTIETAGTQAAPVYKVVGLIDRSGDLILPGGKFRSTDRAKLSDWLTRLRNEGPDRARGGQRLPYGFTKQQFTQAYEDLSQPLRFPTKGMKPAALVDRVADSLQHPLSGEAAAADVLGHGAPLDVELRGMSAGTALAYVLDDLGLALLPRLDAQRRPTYMIAAARPKQEAWPVGWPAEAPRRDLLPSLFDNVDVEINDVELERVLAAVAEHVTAPILVDHAALAGEKVDLGKTKVSLPAKRSMYELVLRKVLVPNRITHDVRVDDAGKPFVWITSTRKAAEAKTKGKEPKR